MSLSKQHDIGAYLTGALARIPETITAAAGNDGVEVDGPTVDRYDFTERHMGSKVLLCWSATLGDGETLTISGNLQDSDDDVTFADYGDALAATIVATGPGGGGTVNGVTAIDANLGPARRYVRLQSTADLSAGATDTVDIAGTLVVGGSSVNPTS